MRAMLLAATAALAMIGQAFAADMPVKAPLSALPGYPYAASGFYWGVGASSIGSSASVSNAGVFALGAGVDMVIGYQWQGGLDFMAAELDVTYTNLGSTSQCGATSCSAGSQWEIEPIYKFGFPTNILSSVLPNLSGVFPGLPALPANASVIGTAHPYLYAGLPIRDISASLGLTEARAWSVQPEVGLGILNQSGLNPGLVFDLRVGCSLGSTGFDFGTASGPVSAKIGTECTTRFHALY